MYKQHSNVTKQQKLQSNLTNKVLASIKLSCIFFVYII